MDKLLTVKDLSSFLNLHPGTIYRLVEKGKVPFIKRKGLGIRFRKEEIEEWLKKGFHRVSQISEILPKFDIALDGYDKLFLERRTEMNGVVRYKYPFGSVLMRKTKNKEERYYIHYQVDGQRIRKALKGVKTRAEAVKVLNAEVADAMRGRYHFQRSDIAFGAMADLFLEKYSKVNKKSWKTSDWVYLRRLKPYFGSYLLSKITPEMVEEYKAKRLSTGIQKCSVNRELSCLRKIYNVAVDWGYTVDNPVRKVKLFSEKENIRERVLKEDEEELLFEAADLHIKPILIVAVNTGMRKSEVFKLRWQNVSFEKREIKIPMSKSGKERRIPINSIVFNLLYTLKAQNGQSEYVFPNPKTEKPYVDIKRSFDSACKKAGVENLRFHDLRHSFATRLARRGVDLVIVKELMGHASIVTTQRYLHSRASEKAQAVETLTKKQQDNPLLWQMGGKSSKEDAVTRSFAVG